MRPLLEPPPPAVAKPIRVTALLASVYVAAVHLEFAAPRYKEAHYVGALFVMGALGLLIGASVAASGDQFGRPAMWAAWVGGAVICVGMLVSFLLSRTVGLPDYHLHAWPPQQVAALVFEAVYLIAFVIALRKRRSRPSA